MESVRHLRLQRSGTLHGGTSTGGTGWQRSAMHAWQVRDRTLRPVRLWRCNEMLHLGLFGGRRLSKIVVAGTGYVGLVTGTCFADLGNEVVGLDVDARKV